MQQSPNLEWKNDANNNIKRCSFSTVITSNIDLPKVNLLSVNSHHAQSQAQQAMTIQPVTYIFHNWTCYERSCPVTKTASNDETTNHLQFAWNCNMWIWQTFKISCKVHQKTTQNLTALWHPAFSQFLNKLPHHRYLLQLSSSQPCKLQIQPEMIGTLQLLSFLKQLQPKTISRLPSTKYDCDKVCKGILNQKSKTIIYHRLNLT